MSKLTNFSEMNIYRVLKLNIILSIVVGIVYSIPYSIITSMYAYDANGEGLPIFATVLSAIVGLILLAWGIFVLYKMWTVRNVNSGFKQFTYSAIKALVIGIVSTVVIIIASIGAVVGILSSLNSGSITELSSSFAVPGAMIAITILYLLIILLISYFTFKQYEGLCIGTEQLLDEHRDSLDEIEAIKMSREIEPLKSISKIAYIYLPIVFIALVILSVIILLLMKSAMAVGLFALILLGGLGIASLVIGIIFLVRFFKFLNIAEKLFDIPYIWNK